MNGYISSLEEAQEEFEKTGVFTRTTYEEILPLLGAYPPALPSQTSGATQNSAPNDGKLSDQLIVSIQEARSRLLSDLGRQLDVRMNGEYDTARFLPDESDLDQIVRYDRALQKKYDWALQKLLESQERRRKTQTPGGTQVPAGQ